MVHNNNDLTTKELVIRLDERVIGLQKSMNWVKNEIKNKANKSDLNELKTQVSNIKLSSNIIVGVSTVITAGITTVATLFGLKKL